jgi:hypothetical protein
VLDGSLGKENVGTPTRDLTTQEKLSSKSPLRSLLDEIPHISLPTGCTHGTFLIPWLRTLQPLLPFMMNKPSVLLPKEKHLL